MQQRIVLRYSLAFKQKVVSEIESGKLTASEARRRYDIKGCETITLWLKKMGKNHLLARVVRVEMKGEKDQLKELKKKNKELESAVANLHLEVLVLKSVINVADAHYGVDLKKTFGEKGHKKP